MLELINQCNTEIKDLNIGPNLEEYCRKQLIMITFSTKNLIFDMPIKLFIGDKFISEFTNHVGINCDTDVDYVDHQLIYPVLEYVPPGEHEVRLVYGDIVRRKYINISEEWCDEQPHHKSICHINDDGIVNVFDVIHLIDLIIEGNTENIMEIADLNGDGIVDASDAIIMTNLILNMDDPFKGKIFPHNKSYDKLLHSLNKLTTHSNINQNKKIEKLVQRIRDLKHLNKIKENFTIDESNEIDMSQYWSVAGEKAYHLKSGMYTHNGSKFMNPRDIKYEPINKKIINKNYMELTMENNSPYGMNWQWEIGDEELKSKEEREFLMMELPEEDWWKLSAERKWVQKYFYDTPMNMTYHLGKHLGCMKDNIENQIQTYVVDGMRNGNIHNMGCVGCNVESDGIIVSGDIYKGCFECEFDEIDPSWLWMSNSHNTKIRCNLTYGYLHRQRNPFMTDDSRNFGDKAERFKTSRKQFIEKIKPTTKELTLTGTTSEMTAQILNLPGAERMLADLNLTANDVAHDIYGAIEAIDMQEEYRFPSCEFGQAYCQGSGLCVGWGCFRDCAKAINQETGAGFNWGSSGGSGGTNWEWDVGVYQGASAGAGLTWTCNIGISW